MTLLYLTREEVAALLPPVSEQLDLVEETYRAVGAGRRLGGTVLAAVAVLALLDVEAFAGAAAGATIGAGFLRLMCLVVIVAVAARLLTTALASGRSR